MAGSKKLTGVIAKKAIKMLKDVAEILESSNISYVLEAGTLLGIVRENRLLPWDNDLDITITEKDENKLLFCRWKFWLKGYRFYVRRYKKNTGPFKKRQVRIIRIQTRKYLFFKDISLMDIFVKRLIDGEYHWTIGVKNPVWKSTPVKYYDERTYLKFKGKKFAVPEEYEGYLEYHYGPDWRIPIKKWNFRTDDNCVKEILE